MNLPELVGDLLNRLDLLERKYELNVQEVISRIKNLSVEEIKSLVHRQSENQPSLTTAFCIETIDIWKQNRIRFFCPIFHDPTRPIKEMPWAYPVSAMGGFDDCGLSWVPPAGSTVCILFENGQRNAPYYIGTTWHRDRGPEKTENNWGYGIKEYNDIWKTHRKGYLVGPNDESQVLPPWNTESYNGFDLSSLVDFANNPEAQKLITYPNIYGFKTPEKHMIKMVDGDPKCNRKWKRFEIMSSCGNWIILKDDHLHYGGQWSNPQCGVPDGDTSCVEGADTSSQKDIAKLQGLSPFGIDANANLIDTTPKEGKKKESSTSCGQSGNIKDSGDNTSSSKIIGGHPSTGHPNTKHFNSQKGANPFFKHQNECRPYMGLGASGQNKCDLPQTGIQIMSISGHTLVFDDSVEEPSGDPEWERSMKKFDFGCNDHYVGRCMGGEEFLTLANGTRIRAKNLCYEKFDLLDVDSKGNYRIVKAYAEPNVVETVYKIKLDNGHEIVRNGEHPLWAMSRVKITAKTSKKNRRPKLLGWTKCNSLYTGNYIAIAQELPTWGESRIKEEDAKVLGYLIGDGGFTGVNVKFTQQDNAQLAELKSLVQLYDCNVKRLGKYDYHLVSNKQNRLGNKIITLLKENELMGCHSRNKHIPDAIFEGDAKTASIFLNRLFSTDGWASVANKNAQIGFCSISEQLTRDVQHICIRLGIHGKVRKKKIKPSKLVKKSCIAWCFEIHKAKDILKFAEKINIYGKENAIATVVELCKKRKHNRQWMHENIPITLRWSRISSIEILEPQLTIAIQVPTTHTFLTEAWEHNTYWKSATGHMIEMSDVESPPGESGSKLRGSDNYIRLKTATGNKIELNDHTVPEKDCPGSPPNIAGDKRGILLASTSGHTIELHDEENKQSGPCRSEGGAPAALAKKAFVKIRTGYGLEILMKDENSQENTVQQHIQISCPQKDNKKRGEHIHRYQEAPSGPGLIFLRAGGNYVIMTYDNMLEIVGDLKDNPSNKIEIITKVKLVYTKDVYINVTDRLHVFLAKQYIFLLAGQDCKKPPEKLPPGIIPPPDPCGPCAGPVCVYVNGCIRLSDRIYASASCSATPASIFMLKPLVKCPESSCC